MVLAAGGVDEQRPAAVLREDGPDIVPCGWICKAELTEHHADRVGTDQRVVTVGADALPDAAVDQFDFHLLVVGLGADVLWPHLVDDAPALAVDVVPDNLADLPLGWRHVPVHAHPLHSGRSGQVQRCAVLACPAMPDGHHALPAALKRTYQLQLVGERLPVIGNCHHRTSPPESAGAGRPSPKPRSAPA